LLPFPFLATYPQAYRRAACLLFGFAPDEVYHTLTVAGSGGGLLPRLFTLAFFLKKKAVYFLRHFLSPEGAR